MDQGERERDGTGQEGSAGDHGKPATLGVMCLEVLA